MAYATIKPLKKSEEDDTIALSLSFAFATPGCGMKSILKKMGYQIDLINEMDAEWGTQV
jgi:hypothetical protein